MGFCSLCVVLVPLLLLDSLCPPASFSRIVNLVASQLVNAPGHQADRVYGQPKGNLTDTCFAL